MYHKRLTPILIALLLTGCSGAVNENKSGEGMLNLDALDAQNKEPKSYDVTHRDLYTEVSVGAELYNDTSYKVYTPGSVCNYSISNISVANYQEVKAGDTIITVTKSHDLIKEKELELEYNRKKQNFEEKLENYDALIADAEGKYQTTGAELNKLTIDKLKLEKSIYYENNITEIDKLKNDLDDYTSEEKTITISAEKDGMLIYNSEPYEGMRINPGASFAEIVDTDEYRYLVSSDAKSLYPGMEVTLKSEDGKNITGTVICDDKFIPMGSIGGSLVEIDAVDGQPVKYTELPQSVTISVRQVTWNSVLSVKDEAIQTDKNGGKYVNRKTADGSERVYVSVAGSLSGYTWITDGLSDGDICLVK